MTLGYSRKGTVLGFKVKGQGNNDPKVFKRGIRNDLGISDILQVLVGHGVALKGQRSTLGLGLTAIRRGFELYECLLVVNSDWVCMHLHWEDHGPHFLNLPAVCLLVTLNIAQSYWNCDRPAEAADRNVKNSNTSAGRLSGKWRLPISCTTSRRKSTQINPIRTNWSRIHSRDAQISVIKIPRYCQRFDTLCL